MSAQSNQSLHHGLHLPSREGNRAGGPCRSRATPPFRFGICALEGGAGGSGLTALGQAVGGHWRLGQCRHCPQVGTYAQRSGRNEEGRAAGPGTSHRLTSSLSSGPQSCLERGSRNSSATLTCCSWGAGERVSIRSWEMHQCVRTQAI